MTLKLAMDLNIHRFFMIDLHDGKYFNETFNKAVDLIHKIDTIIKNGQLEVAFKAIDSRKNRDIKKSYNIRYLAYAYAFYKTNPDYAVNFLKIFMLSDSNNDGLNQIQKSLEDHTSTHVSDPQNFENMLLSIVRILELGGYKFFMNIIFFCDNLANDEQLEKFFKYYQKTAKKIYFENQFKLLKLDEVSSDEAQ